MEEHKANMLETEVDNKNEKPWGRIFVVGFLVVFFVFHAIFYPVYLPFYFIVLALSLLFAWCYKKAGRKGKIAIVLVGFFLIAVPVLFLNMAIFRPISSLMVNRAVQAYVEEHYADFDLVIGHTSWGFLSSGDFVTRVYCRNNREMYFHVTTSDRDRTFRDSYTNGEFWARPLQRLYEQPIKEQFADNFRRFSVTVSGLSIGEKLSDSEHVRVTASIHILVEELDPQIMAEQFLAFYQVLQGSQPSITHFNIEFFKSAGNVRPVALRLPTAMINEDLSVFIAYLQANLDEENSYGDREEDVFYRTMFW